MIRTGSLVRFIGKCREICTGKYLTVHAAKGDKIVVWIDRSGRWAKKTVGVRDVELVVE